MTAIQVIAALRGRPVAGSRCTAMRVTASVLPRACPTERAIELTAFATPVSGSSTACTTRAGSAAYATVTETWVSNPATMTCHGSPRQRASRPKPATPKVAPTSRVRRAPRRGTTLPAKGATTMPAALPGSR
jgi:hypothetical protein